MTVEIKNCLGNPNNGIASMCFLFIHTHLGTFFFYIYIFIATAQDLISYHPSYLDLKLWKLLYSSFALITSKSGLTHCGLISSFFLSLSLLTNLMQALIYQRYSTQTVLYTLWPTSWSEVSWNAKTRKSLAPLSLCSAN